MSKWKEQITEFEDALSITNKFWVVANVLICVGVPIWMINLFWNNYEKEAIIVGFYMIVGFISSEIWRRIVIGFGYVLLSIESKLPSNSSTNNQSTKNDEWKQKNDEWKQMIDRATTKS